MNFLKKVVKENLDIVLFVLIMFVKLISVNFTIKLNGFSQNTVLGCLGSILVLAGIAFLFTKRLRIPVLFLFNIIVTLIVYINNVYHRYFLDVTTIGLVKQLGIASDVSDSVFALLSPLDIIYFLDIIVLIILYVKTKNKLEIKTFKFTKRILIAICTLIIGFVFSTLSVNGLAKAQVGILNTFYDKKTIVREIGLLNYHAIDINTVSYTHLTLPTKNSPCRSRWSPYH